MEPRIALRRARREAGFSQVELAERSGTSQATISAYETGAKQPSIATLDRLLAATGRELGVSGALPDGAPSDAIARRGRILAEVLALAETLPARRRGPLRYPKLETLRPEVGPSPTT